MKKEIRSYYYERKGGLGVQSMEELRRAHEFYTDEGNEYALNQIVLEIRSRRTPSPGGFQIPRPSDAATNDLMDWADEIAGS